ncbi:MAG: hypothetical protein GXO08_05630, partial [Aquificae bacterium]|nr:hypothetical protein [Aquificota bacterium]
FWNNGGISIDLDLTHLDGVNSGVNPNGDGVSPNDGQVDDAQPNKGLDYPIITRAVVRDGTFIVEGYVGTNDSPIAQTLTVEVYFAADDGNNDGEVEKGDGLSVPHGEGRYYFDTCTTDSSGKFTCQFTLNQQGELYVTAIAIDADGNTSEFGPNRRVYFLTSVVKGYVYKDQNHNTLFDNYESGIGEVQVELWYLKDGTWTLVDFMNTTAEGYYEFKPWDVGTFRVIEDYNNTAGDTPDEGSDPDGYLSTTPNVVELTLAEDTQATVNFGDFYGSKVRGFVFNDNGSVPNDAVKQDDESGIPGVKVQACADRTCTSVIDETFTDVHGYYEVWISGDAVPEGERFWVMETDPPGYTSTGASKGDTATRDYTDTLILRNRLTRTQILGKVYPNPWNFADVKKLEAYWDQSVALAPGQTATLYHKAIIYTPGTLAVGLENVEVVNATVYPDLNCDLKPDGGPAPINEDGYFVLGTDLPSGEYCFLVKYTVPSYTEPGTTEGVTVWVYEDWLGTIYANGETGSIYDDITFVTDTVQVTATYSGGLLRLTKEVRNVSRNEDFGYSNEAQPGEILEYRITFKNISAQNVHSIEIADVVSSYVKIVKWVYSGATDLKLVIGNDTFYRTLDLNDSDNDGVGVFNDTIKVDVTKATDGQYEHLAPGMEGQIYYQVRVLEN